MNNIDFINLIDSNLNRVPIQTAFENNDGIEIINILSKSCISENDIPDALNRITTIPTKWTEVKTSHKFISIRTEDRTYTLKIFLK